MSEREWLAHAAVRELGEDWTDAAAHIARAKDEIARLLTPAQDRQKFRFPETITDSLAQAKAEMDAIPDRDLQARYLLLERLLDLTRDPLLRESAVCVELLASVVGQLAWLWPHFHPDDLASELESIASSRRGTEAATRRAALRLKERTAKDKAPFAFLDRHEDKKRRDLIELLMKPEHFDMGWEEAKNVVRRWKDRKNATQK